MSDTVTKIPYGTFALLFAWKDRKGKHFSSNLILTKKNFYII